VLPPIPISPRWFLSSRSSISNATMLERALSFKFMLTKAHKTYKMCSKSSHNLSIITLFQELQLHYT
jgi:hypothetical protein